MIRQPRYKPDTKSPDPKPSSNSDLPVAWITGPATGPSLGRGLGVFLTLLLFIKIKIQMFFLKDPNNREHGSTFMTANAMKCRRKDSIAA
jgi:hypothetical protein